MILLGFLGSGSSHGYRGGTIRDLHPRMLLIRMKTIPFLFLTEGRYYIIACRPIPNLFSHGIHAMVVLNHIERQA